METFCFCRLQYSSSSSSILSFSWHSPFTNSARLVTQNTCFWKNAIVQKELDRHVGITTIQRRCVNIFLNYNELQKFMNYKHDLVIRTDARISDMYVHCIRVITQYQKKTEILLFLTKAIFNCWTLMRLAIAFPAIKDAL